MYIIVGLGNPGKEYAHTRHNVGFETIDILADRMGIEVEEKKHKGLCGKGILAGQKVILLKPQTYMKLSGDDDISLEPGQLRLRGKGSAGGHNGIKNIIAHLGTQEFPRIKVGVGDKPKGMDLADYVLGHFSKEDQAKMDEAFKDAADAAEMILDKGMDAAMNHYNMKKKGE